MLILSFIVFLFSAYIVCFAQKGGGLIGNTVRSDMTGSGGSSTKKGGGTPKAKYVKVVEYRDRFIDRTPNTGWLSIVAEPKANILIEPIGNERGKAEGIVIPANQRHYSFNGLKPGRYRVAAALEGYEDIEREVVVVRGQPTVVDLKLKPITYDVKIKANIDNGEVKYSFIEKISGQEKYNPVGDMKVVQIKNGVAVLPNLRDGLYGVDIESGELGYEKIKLLKFNLPGSTEYTVEFKKIRSENRFSAQFMLDEWLNVPSGWKISGRKMTTNGKGVVIPSDEQFHNYDDFQIVSSVSLVNGVAASFVVRVVDERNYYLIQITGKDAPEPYLLSGITVKDGVAKRFQTIPIEHKASTIEKGRYFKVFITASRNTFKVDLWDDVKAEDVPLGVLTDSYNTFPTGAPGIAASFDNQKTEIGAFQVCTPKCPPQ
jgi:hypothetical protein